MPAHVQILSKVTTVDFPDEWYDLNSQSHFWFDWRIRTVLRQLRAMNTPLDRPLRGIDIGCGTGILREQIEAATKWTIDGFDLNLSALSRTRPGRGGTFYYNVFDERPEFLGVYDVAFLFDVIEHIEPTAPFLQAVIRYLKPGGYLFINVPALELIRSKYDDAAGHYRRYNKPTLRARRSSARFGMVVDDIRYWGFSMVPLLLARRIYLSGAKSTDTTATIRSGFKPPGALVHSVLRSIMRVRIAACRASAVLGTSLLMAARKP